MVEIWLPYGKTEVCLRVPTKNILSVVDTSQERDTEDPQLKIKESLKNPLGTKPLSKIVKRGDQVSIAMRETFSLSNKLLLSEILEELQSADIRNGDITILGSFDPFRSYKIWEDPGYEETSRDICFIKHDVTQGEKIFIGKTSHGTKVFLNKRFVEADVKIVIGNVEPHLFSGYTGGYECILPGISSVKTIEDNLLLTLSGSYGRGLIKGNSVHEDRVDASNLINVDFTLNTVRNCKFDIVNIFAGDLDKTFNKAVSLSEELFQCKTKGLADILFLSAGGYPFDSNLFESCMCLDTGFVAVEDKQVVILVAECKDGLGNRKFYESMSETNDPKSLHKELRKNFSVGSLLAYFIKNSLKQTRIYLVSALPDYYIPNSFSARRVRTVNEAYEAATKEVKESGKVSAILYGNHTIPLIEG